MGTGRQSGITAGASFSTVLRMSGGVGGNGTGGGSNAYTYDGVGNAWTLVGGPGSNKQEIGFNGQYTGIGISDFLEGWPYYSNTEGYGTFMPRANTGLPWTDFFVQDDWKVSSRLTINLGLRWDLITPRAERRNILTTFNPANGQIVAAGDKLLSQFTDQRLVTANSGLFTTASEMGWPLDSMIREPRTDFSPCFGFAYRPFRGNKTVIRGTGYSMLPGLTSRWSGTWWGLPISSPRTR